MSLERLEQAEGQWKAQRILRHALQSGRISHAYLFNGPSGTGRMATAQAFAKALFCTSNGWDACGQCLACRKFEHGNQTALLTIAPDGQSIKIDQIRELQRNLSYRGTETERTVYLVERAETMTLQAANSLLKFLEEPLSPIVAILITDNGQAILPTIRSRTQWVPFLPIPPESMLEKLVLEGASPLLARAAVHLSSGLDGARQILQQNEFAEIRNLVIQLGKESLSRFTAAMITAQQQLFKTDLSAGMDMLLSLLTLWFKDFTQFQAGRQDKIVFIDQLDWISSHAYDRSFAGWVSCMEHILEAGKRIRANVSPQLAFEQLLVHLQEG
ncbi:DNA polymerase III subunit delta' [Paenibacillus agaridevorans]|uniref:DNA polymerase III subunit delta' n=1 Tax=Paenibacillus agaridevorans TaxID=171404 RepID=A0A2R5EP39_9BACL|nr:DNA polymerase III subunit delta' [Paenibacillus agaridevorans]GBG08432.1 DNA polymerase III subunit delta' [Paenibacillus agaridevorans]